MPSQRFAPPARSLLGLEGVRAIGDMGLLAAAAPLLARSRRGDGHTVVVLPGLAAGDGSTDPLRRFLRVLGYDVLGWGLGRNVGPTVDIRRGLADLVAAAYRRRQQPVSLVGWSMGGIYARELARQAPDAVREVVTLGSPFRDRERAAALPVPATSLYSRSDGIVPWERCLDLVSERAENIEVVASHIGLGHNPAVLHVVADRLAQPAGTWTPFTPRGAWVPFFPRRRAA